MSNFVKMVVLVLLFITTQANAQTAARYAVKKKTAAAETVLPSQEWSTKQIDGGEAVELDRGNDDIEIHDKWNMVAALDDTTQTVEQFTIHPSIAAQQDMTSVIGHGSKVNAESKEVIESWPVFHQISSKAGVVTLISTHFFTGASKVVWKRVYVEGLYFLPIVLIKETYEKATDAEPVEIMFYTRIAYIR